MGIEVFKDGSTDTVEALMVPGGGLYMEYYSYLRHFSFGMALDFNYYLDMNDMALLFMPFMKCSF